MGRYPGAPLEELRARIEETVARASSSHPYLAAHPAVVSYDGFDCEGYELPADEPVIEELRACHNAVIGKDPELVATTATTDARTFGLYGGIPSTCFGPYGEGYHAADERVFLPSITEHGPGACPDGLLVVRCAMRRPWRLRTCAVDLYHRLQTPSWRFRCQSSTLRSRESRISAGTSAPTRRRSISSRRPRSTCWASTAGSATSASSITTTPSTGTTPTCSFPGSAAHAPSPRSRRSATTCSATRRSGTGCAPAVRAGKAVFLMFDPETEELAGDLGLKVAFPPASLRNRLDSQDRDHPASATRPASPACRTRSAGRSRTPR